ncbi:hypothetical protein ACHAXA_004577 [Cyclostephanos tholiformis]|uniref:Uncharacterized protein n=1 Tax=Cyclostephanos tholiformis TaxID=382380 RepID=A0ABD3R9Z1_9STRA
MADCMEGSATQQRLDALQCWLCDFPQLEACHERVADFDDVVIANKIIEIAEEICDCEISIPRPTSASKAWAAIHGLARDNGLPIDDIDPPPLITRECQSRILCALLCHALSDRCERQRDYVGRIMAMGRSDVQQEIMRIIQESALYRNDDDDNNGDTGEYSAYMEASGAASVSASFELEGKIDTKRDRIDAFGDDNLHFDSPQGKKRPQVDRNGIIFEGMHNVVQHRSADDDIACLEIAKLQKELNELRQREMDFSLKVDEERAQHRSDMLQVESRHLRTTRDLEGKYTKEISEQKREIEMLRHYEQSAKKLSEENSRLRDELDVLECSKEKLAFAEEQLRKFREKVELIGDLNDALQREEKAHAASVDKCLALEGELAVLKPLKRQLEEYRVRATDAEVALAECREDLRRLKLKSSGLEDTNEVLQRGARLQHKEAINLQKRLQEDGGQSDKGGFAVGIGISELNPELMEELKTLRSEYARLKEFESKREVDSVQRLEESYDDARRLSEKFKAQFCKTKSELEDTQQLLCESEVREANLMVEAEQLKKKIIELDDEMKEERLKSHKAALDAERNFQNEKKSIINKGRQDLIDLEEKLTQKIEAERKQHKDKMDRAEAQRMEMESNLSEQLTTLREHSSNVLRSTKELGQKMLDDMEQSKKAEVEKLSKDKADEIEALIAKGKAMIRESRQKAKALQMKITEEYEVKISSLEESLVKVKSIQEEYEKIATAKIAKRDQQIKVLESRIRESIISNSQLEDKVKKAERSSRELAGDNDRLRRQLGSRFGLGASAQNNLEELTSLCKSLQEENRRLKEINSDRLISAMDVRESIPSSDTTQPVTSFSKTALTEFREEYEEKIEELENEKRDLIMKSSAAATETRKAEQRSWELEEELTKVRSELTSAKLALQRNERRSNFSLGLSSSSKQKENAPNILQDPSPAAAETQNFTPKIEAKTNSQTRPVLPLLMDHFTPKSDSDECRQS